MLTIKKRNFHILLIVILVIGAMIATSFNFVLSYATDQIKITRSEYEEYQYFKKNYSELLKLQALIERYYYLPVKQKDLVDGVYKGLFQGIGDPYSSYLTKDELKSIKIATDGEYEGIGVIIAPDKSGNIMVVGAYDGSAAAEAGITSGDIILAIDGKEYNAKQFVTADNALLGAAGTKVRVKILRQDREFEVELVRQKITAKTVRSEILPSGIGYVRISSFNKKTAEDFEKVLRDFEISKTKGMIIDLRDNPGGIVSSGVKIADMLLPEGIVTYTENRKGEKKYYRSKAGATDLPFVILINGGTASTSELLAAAVKDYNKGELVGTKSFGKGIIQELMELSGGGAAKITVEQYFSPDGNVIHGIGVEPDFTVEQQKRVFSKNKLPQGDLQLKKAEELLLD